MQANLQEGRHALTRKIFHGGSGQLYQGGMEDQIGGALGLVLNALVLFNTCSMDPPATGQTRSLHSPSERVGPVTVWPAASGSASRVGPVGPDPPVTKTCEEGSGRVSGVV